MNTARDITYKLGGTFAFGRGLAPCPICQPERRRDQRALSIRESNGKLLLHCFKSGCDFVDIARAVDLAPDRANCDWDNIHGNSEKQPQYRANRFREARSQWFIGEPISGTRGETYLCNRGITCPLPPSLRWTPKAFHSPSSSWHGAITADVTTGGIHRTFIDSSGKSASGVRQDDAGALFRRRSAAVKRTRASCRM